MSFLEQHLLTATVFLPFLGALILLSFPRDRHDGVRGFTMAVSLVDLALGVMVWARFDPMQTGLQLVESAAWVPTFGIRYALGVDGLTILLVVLTVFLAPIVVLSTYSSVGERVREYMVCLLFLQTGMLGAFVATDLFLFYVFWEVMLVPMYFLIGIWGGRRRVYAAIKFFLYTMAGSLLMLVAILYVVWAVREQGGLTFSWPEVQTRLAGASLGGVEIWLFLAFALAFAIKVPMFPFHTWLPDAHVEAPTGGSVILAGVLLKLGTFGFLRYALGMFPQTAAAFLPALGLLSVIGIIYGALVSMVQQDLKRLVAFSSVSHLGFVMLGLAAMTVTGVSGGVLQMVNHGISTGALFLLVGVIYERRHSRMIEDFGGLAKVMPRYSFFWVLITLSSIGLPGLNGFVGEFLILIGTFQSEGVQVATYTSTLALAGMLAVQLVAVVALALLGFALWRPEVAAKAGIGTRVAALVAMTALAVWLVMPPMGAFAGGLLVRPLVAPMQRTEAFRELFAVLAVIAASGVIFAAVYLLWATQRVFFGPIRHVENEALQDLTARETLVLAPLALAAILMGVYPQPFLRAIDASVVTYTQQFRAQARLPQIASQAASHPTEVRSAEPRRIPGAAVQPVRDLLWRRTLEEAQRARSNP